MIRGTNECDNWAGGKFVSTVINGDGSIGGSAASGPIKSRIGILTAAASCLASSIESRNQEKDICDSFLQCEP